METLEDIIVHIMLYLCMPLLLLGFSIFLIIKKIKDKIKQRKELKAIAKEILKPQAEEKEKK